MQLRELKDFRMSNNFKKDYLSSLVFAVPGARNMLLQSRSAQTPVSNLTADKSI